MILVSFHRLFFFFFGFFSRTHIRYASYQYAQIHKYYYILTWVLQFDDLVIHIDVMVASLGCMDTPFFSCNRARYVFY